jgi:hypothetical protein
MFDISYALVQVFSQKKHSQLLAPWAKFLFNIAGSAEDRCNDAGWQRLTMRCEVAPYACVLAHVESDSAG